MAHYFSNQRKALYKCNRLAETANNILKAKCNKLLLSIFQPGVFSVCGDGGEARNPVIDEEENITERRKKLLFKNPKGRKRAKAGRKTIWRWCALALLLAAALL